MNNIYILYGVLLLITIIFGFILYKRSVKKQKAIIENINTVIGERVWSIPADLQCQKCKRVDHFNFDLGMYNFTCSYCKTKNRVFINFVTAIESNEE